VHHEVVRELPVCSVLPLGSVVCPHCAEPVALTDLIDTLKTSTIR